MILPINSWEVWSDRRFGGKERRGKGLPFQKLQNYAFRKWAVWIGWALVWAVGGYLTASLLPLGILLTGLVVLVTLTWYMAQMAVYRAEAMGKAHRDLI